MIYILIIIFLVFCNRTWVFRRDAIHRIILLLLLLCIILKYCTHIDFVVLNSLYAQHINIITYVFGFVIRSRHVFRRTIIVLTSAHVRKIKIFSLLHIILLLLLYAPPGSGDGRMAINNIIIHNEVTRRYLNERAYTKE